MDEFILYLLGLNKKINAVDIEIVLREKYETIYHIFNHDSISPSTGFNGLALVSLHEPENLAYNEFRRDVLMKKFMDYKIATYFGCSWMEFIKQEYSEVERMLKIAEPLALEDLKQLNHARDEINRLKGSL